MSKLVSIRKHQYKLKEDGNTLQYTESEKDIGVTMDEKHSFDKHISEKVNKANSIIGIIRRTMEYMDNNSFCHLVDDAPFSWMKSDTSGSYFPVSILKSSVMR
jgi:hypothetical protein